MWRKPTRSGKNVRVFPDLPRWSLLRAASKRVGRVNVRRSSTVIIGKGGAVPTA